MKRIAAIIAGILLLSAIIPSYAQTYEAPTIVRTKDKVRVAGKVYWSHVVTEKQTLWSISKAYEVSVDDIYEANPTLNLPTEGLKTGQILMIPVQKGKAAKDKAKDKKESRKEAAQIQEKALFPGSPQKKEKNKDRQTPAEETPAAVRDSLDKTTHEDRHFDEIWHFGTEAELTQEKSGTVQEDSLFIADIPSRIALSVVLPVAEGKNEGFTEFYSGVLLAARELGQRGIGIDLNLCSPADSLSAPWKKADVIIGPVSPKDINNALRHTPFTKHIISPLDPRAASLADSMRVVQAPTQWTDQIRELVAWASEERMPGDSLIVVREKGAALTSASKFLISELQKSGLPTKTISYSILEGLQVSETFQNLASKTGTTRYFIASENEAFVGDVIRNANLMTYKGYQVTVYCHSKVRSFDLIDVETFHNVGLRMTATYFTDYTSPEVQAFVLAYRALFDAEPGSYAFQGYDTAMYFSTVCARYGRGWFRKLPQCDWRGLQTDFHFEQGFGRKGQVNRAVRRIIFQKDYSVEML